MLAMNAFGIGLDPVFTPPEPVCKMALVSLRVERACHDDVNCPPGSHCINGRYVVGGRCLGHVDCPVGQRCVSGVCK